MSELGRLTGIFWEPKPVYQDLAERPRWWVPLILLTCLSLVMVFAISQWIGWDTVLEQQLEANQRFQQLPAEQQQAIMQQQGGFVGIAAYFGAGLGTAAIMLIVAGVMLMVFRMAGGSNISYKQAFSVTAYSFMPTALSVIMTIVVMKFVHPSDFNIQNPLPLNAGWLVNTQESPAWLNTLASSLDLFTIWIMLLLALGFSVASKKLSYSKCLSLIGLIWVISVVLKTGWAAVFG